MKFFIRTSDKDPGRGHMMRCVGLAEQLLADGHEVRVCADKWPAEVVKKLPQGLSDDCDRFGAIEVIDSYDLKPVTKKAIRIPDHFWFLRNELRSVPRGRSQLSAFATVLGGGDMPAEGSVTTDSEGVVYVAPTFDTYVAMLPKIDVIRGAFGISSWERCYLGIPTLGIVIAENQAGNAQIQIDAFAAIGLINYDNEPLESVQHKTAQWLRTLRLNPDLVEFMSKKAMQLVPHDSYQDFLGML